MMFNWLGHWIGSWFGSGTPAPTGSMTGSATVQVFAAGTVTARASLSGSATASITSVGTLSAVSTPVVTGQFWADGFWAAGFWSDGFWGLLEQPYNTLSYKHQIFVRTLLESIYVETTVDYIVAHAEHFDLSVRDSVEALKVLTRVDDLRILPAVKREVKEEPVKRVVRHKKVDPLVFVQQRTSDLNVMIARDSELFVEPCETLQIIVNTGKSAAFVVESDKL